MRDRFAAALGGWGLRDPRPLDVGCVALVCEAVRESRPVVLKVNPGGHREEAQLAGEGEALAFWGPTGAVPQLLGSRDRGLTVLMERLLPGTALDETGLGWHERLELLGGLAARLHASAPPAEICISMAEFTRDWRRALAGEPARLAELEQLAAPADDDVLVHADLHGGNVLLHNGDWKVIDPKGVRGDRHADTWALLEPEAPDCTAADDAWARVTRYAEAAGMDPRRAAAWIRVRAHAEATWVDEDWAARLRALAAALG